MNTSFIRNFFEKIPLFDYLAAIVLAVLSYKLRLQALLQTEFANGWDAYFYLVQLKSWIEEGAMHSPDASLIYPFMRFVHYFVGDYVLSYKISAAILAGAFTFSLCVFAKTWSRSFWILLLLGAYSVFSPHLTYFTAQYPKNLLGLVLFVLFLASLKSKYKWLFIVFMALNFFGHRLTMALVLITGILYAAFQQLEAKHWYLVGTLGLCVMALSVLFPSLLNLSDVQRIQETFSLAYLHFSPYTFVIDFGDGDRISPFWLFEIIFTTVLFFVGWLYLFFTDEKRSFLPLLITSSILLCPFFEWSLTGMSYRFFLVFVLLSPLWLALTKPKESGGAWLLFFAIAFLVASVFSNTTYQAALHDPNYARYQEVTKKVQTHLPQDSTQLIIAHNALAEYFTFHTRIDAMPWLPEYQMNEDKLWRIATGLRYSQLRHYLTDQELEESHRLTVRYYLIKEKYWQKMLKRIHEENDQDLLEKLNTWQNPSRIRPAFLLQKKN